jgi:MSHA biogenesis protein MshI
VRKRAQVSLLAHRYGERAALEGFGAVFSFLGRSRGVPGLVGVQIEEYGFSLAHVVPVANARPQLAHCRYVPLSSPALLEDALRDAVRQAKLERARAVFVLGPGSYALRIVDAPQVQPEERKAAARWSIQELVDFDASDAAVDVFEVPAEIHREGSAARLFVAAAPGEAVRRSIALARAAGLELHAIDITELALRNVAALHPAESGGVAAVLLGDEGLITVSREGALFVARWVGVSEREVENAVAKPEGDAVQGEESLDALVLEIQRSLDYYEHELRQRPVRSLLVAPLEHGASTLEEWLARNLSLPVEWLDLNRLLTVPTPLAAGLQRRCLAAVGGALRAEDGA